MPDWWVWIIIGYSIVLTLVYIFWVMPYIAMLQIHLEHSLPPKKLKELGIMSNLDKD